MLSAQRRLHEEFLLLLDDPEATLVLSDLLETGRLAAVLGPQDTHDLAPLIRKVARSVGIAGRREALLELSAAALRAASTIPTKAPGREHAVNGSEPV